MDIVGTVDISEIDILGVNVLGVDISALPHCGALAHATLASFSADELGAVVTGLLCDLKSSVWRMFT